MGILDDLAMGFGAKERTADYDARTARTIAANDATRNISNDFERTKIQTRLRNDPNFDYRNYTRRNPMGISTGYSPSRQYLDRVGARGGYDAGGYNPSIVDDKRPFMQRALFSPESTPSPSPYAIGPMQMDGPLQIPSMLGILNSFANTAFDRPLTGKPLSSGAVDALDGVKRFRKVASPAGILTAEDGQITDEELADVTEAPENEFSGMNATEIKDALMAKFSETGEDPTLTYTEELFGGDDAYINYLMKRPLEDRITAYSNRLAGR